MECARNELQVNCKYLVESKDSTCMYKDVKRRDETEETRIGEIEENGRKISNGNTESAFGEK